MPGGIEKGKAFRFKTLSGILIVGPSGCGKTCFTESLLLDQLEELFVNPPPTIHYCYGAWQDGFQTMKEAGAQFHEGVPTTFHLQKWFPNGDLLVFGRSDGRRRTRQKVTRLIHQTFTSPKYHRIVLVPRHVFTGEIRQEYFQDTS